MQQAEEHRCRLDGRWHAAARHWFLHGAQQTEEHRCHLDGRRDAAAWHWLLLPFATLLLGGCMEEAEAWVQTGINLLLLFSLLPLLSYCLLLSTLLLLS